MGLFNTAIGGLQGALTGDWASAASGILSGASQDYENLEARLAAKRANNEQIAFWNMQNEYNSPVQQMARLKEAGLNPMLVYGGGNVTGNATSAIGTAQTSANKTNYQASLQGIKSLADLDNLKANTENTKMSTQSTEAGIGQTKANTLATYQDITNMQTANKLQQAQLEEQQQNIQMNQLDLDYAKREQKLRYADQNIRARKLGYDKEWHDSGAGAVEYGIEKGISKIGGVIGLGQGLGATQSGFANARLNNARANAMISYTPRYRNK